MSGMDAFKEEMRFLDLTAEEAREMDVFALATRATLMAVPDPAIGRNLVPELATAAATGHRDNVVAAPVTARSPRRRRRLPMVARIVFAVALLPALFAGLAVAGVKLPDPANNAFESMGVTLPNQDSDTSATGDDDGTEPGDQGKGAGQDKSNPAREGGRGNGAQGNGRALGKRGIPPGHNKSKSNHAGGNGKGKAIGKTDGTPPGQAKDKPTPPGHAKSPPSQANGKAKANAGGSNAGGGGSGASQNAAGGNGQGAVNKTVSGVKSLLD